MRVFSQHGMAKFILGIIGILWILALLLVVTNASLSCIDQNGCLRSFCKVDWLRVDYKLLIKDSSSQFCSN